MISGTSPVNAVIGWDLGGAHLKAALSERPGQLTGVLQIPCPLWRGLDVLDRAIGSVLNTWPQDARHIVTMTGELADLFPDRATGVKALVDHMLKRLPIDSISVFAGRVGLISAADTLRHLELIASANWLATATCVASCLEQGLLVDIGSTTTDIIPVKGGQVLTISATDADRLARDELVYTGVVRTPVCAVTGRAPFRGEWQHLAAEFFSSMADIYRLLGVLPKGADQMETPDGRGKNWTDSMHRLARMLGRDATLSEQAEWRLVAAYIARRQLNKIQDAMDRVLSGNQLDRTAPLIGAGVGRFLVRRLAGMMERPYADFGSLRRIPPELADVAANCAPAVALALIANLQNVGY